MAGGLAKFHRLGDGGGEHPIAKVCLQGVQHFLAQVVPSVVTGGQGSGDHDRLVEVVSHQAQGPFNPLDVEETQVTHIDGVDRFSEQQLPTGKT